MNLNERTKLFSPKKMFRIKKVLKSEMSGSDRNPSTDGDAILHRHLHVKSFAKMDQSGDRQSQQNQQQQQHQQQHQQHSHQHQDQHPTCESPSPKIKRKIGNEVSTFFLFSSLPFSLIFGLLKEKRAHVFRTRYYIKCIL